MWRRPSARSRRSQAWIAARSSAGAEAGTSRPRSGARLRSAEPSITSSPDGPTSSSASEQSTPTSSASRRTDRRPASSGRPSQVNVPSGESADPPIWSVRPPAYSSRAAIRFSVSVPVLSAQTTVTDPSASAALRRADQRALPAHPAARPAPARWWPVPSAPRGSRRPPARQPPPASVAAARPRAARARPTPPQMPAAPIASHRPS